jgi:hypothetical protein
MDIEPGSRGAFADTVGWLVRATSTGTVSRLARESGVSERTLQKWLAGDHPRSRLTRNVEMLDDWALRSTPGYPPPGGTGQRLTDLVVSRSETTGPSSAPHPRARALAVAAVLVLVLAALISVLTAREVSGHSHVPAVTEYGDNHRGSPVFSTTYGAAVPAGIPARIPYATRVDVTCSAPNRSGIASVSAFYLVADGRWHDLWVVADTMTNGGPVGNTTSPDVDPAVPTCSAGEH